MIRGASWRDEVYATLDGVELTCRRYRPVSSGEPSGSRRPLLVHVPHGGWANDTAELVPIDHKALAALGVVSVVVDNRSAPEHHHPAAAVDTERALRWIAAHLDDLGADERHIVWCGSGTGVHALLSAWLTSPALHRLPQPVAIAAIWPAVDPLTARRRRHHGADQAFDYFRDRRQMRRAGVGELALDLPAGPRPPLVVTRSSTVNDAPPEVTDELAFAWRRGGGRVEVLETEPPVLDATELVASLALPDVERAPASPPLQAS